MESLQAEVAPFGIHTTIVNPGFFRTELLTDPEMVTECACGGCSLVHTYFARFLGS